jgi:hypothetical protein
MAEIRTVTTLRRKRDEISRSIRLYEKQLAQAHSDLAHVTAAIRIFEVSSKPADMARYVDTYRLFKRGEPLANCAAALAKGLHDTRKLALAMMAARSMDRADTVLAKGPDEPAHSLGTDAGTARAGAPGGEAEAVTVWRLPKSHP